MNKFTNIYTFNNPQYLEHNLDILIILAILFILLFLNFFLTKISLNKLNQSYSKIILTFFIILLILNLVSFIDFLKIKYVFDNNKFNVVEGNIQYFSPYNSTKREDEHFTVNNIYFSYSDFNKSHYGYNKTSVNGSPIYEGLYVRISYYKDNNKNIILKFDIANH